VCFINNCFLFLLLMHVVVIILNELLQLFLKLHCISFFFNIGALSMFYDKQKKLSYFEWFYFTCVLSGSWTCCFTLTTSWCPKFVISDFFILYFCLGWYCYFLFSFLSLYVHLLQINSFFKIQHSKKNVNLLLESSSHYYQIFNVIFSCYFQVKRSIVS
jgi:hypothetical protein